MDDLNTVCDEIQTFKIADSVVCQPEHCRNFVNSSRTSLKLLHINIRSINKNFSELELLLARISISCDVIVLSECWLSKAAVIPPIDGFTFYKSSFSNQNDGIVVYVKLNLNHSVEENNILEANSLTLKLSNDIAIVAAYRPPSFRNSSIFINSLSDYLSSLSAFKTVALVGDININIVPENNDPSSEDYLNALAFQGMLPAHLLATRLKSCLDHVFLKTDRGATVLVLDSTITDHFPLILCCDRHSKSSYKPRRSFRKIDEQAVVAEIKETDFCSILDSDDPENAAERLVEVISCILEKHTKMIAIPSKKRTIKPWITPGLLKCIRNRDKLFKNLKKDPDNEIKLKTYKRYRNFCCNLFKNIKHDYEKKEFEKAGSNPKATWEVIKQITNTKKPVNKSVELLNITDNPQHSVNYVNRYFSEVGRKLALKILSETPKLMSDEPNGFKSKEKSLKSMGLLDVDSDEIIGIIAGLKASSAVGWDYIPCTVVKATRLTLAPVITYVINLCLRHGIFPRVFKKALIHPIYKAGDRCSVDNYRPISVLSTFSKIFEKCLNFRLTNYLNNFNILSENQYGFRKARSTEDAVLELTDSIARNIDAKLKSTGIFLDLSKAFDTVSVPLMLTKLESIGVRGIALKMFTSYLSERTQRVIIDNFTSQDVDISFGVPQGSVLGPTLFLIYVNDLCNLSLPHCKILAYADDTALLVTGKTWDEVKYNAETAIQSVTIWLSQNLLTLNIKKTNCLTFTATASSQPPADYAIRVHTCSSYPQSGCDCVGTERVSYVKYLGILIDNTLNWKSQIALSTSRTRKLIYIFRKLRASADQQTLKTVYFALAQSILSYCVAAWGCAPKTSILTLERAQRAILKVMHNKPRLYPTNDLYMMCKVLSVRKLFILNVILRTHHTLPFHSTSQLQQPRRPPIVCPPRPSRTVLAARHFYFISPVLYNRINKLLKIHPLTRQRCKIVIRNWLSSLTYDETEGFVKN